MPDANSGGLSEKFDKFKEYREARPSCCTISRPARWQRGGQRNQRRKRAITCAEVNTGGFLTTTPPPAHADRSFEELLLERRTVRTNAARQNHQTALGKFLKFVQKRTHPLVEDVEIDGALVAYPNDCSVKGVQHHNGSKFHVVVIDCWLSFNHFRSSKLPKSHPHVAVHASVRASGIEKERSCPTAGATSPVLVDRDRRRWSIYQKKGPRWVGPHGPALASLGQQALALTKVWNSGGDHPEFRLPRHSTLVLPELWDPAG